MATMPLKKARGFCTVFTILSVGPCSNQIDSCLLCTWFITCSLIGSRRTWVDKNFILYLRIKYKYVIGIQSTNSSTTMSIVTDFRKIIFFPSYSYLPLNFFTPSNFSISQEWELLTGAVIVSDTKSSDPLPAWIEQDRAFNLFLLQSALPSLYNKLNLSSESLWRSFMKHDGILPDHCEELTAFQKALVTHCLKPDQTYSALTRFALDSLGEISFSSLLRLF